MPFFVPPKDIISTPSPCTDICTTRATAPFVMTASFSASSSRMTRPSCSARTWSIMRGSTEKSSSARRRSSLSSLLSSSAMKPMVPMFTPRTGIPAFVAALEAWRIVPSPPKQTSRSASRSSWFSSVRTTLSGSSKLRSTSKARQMRVSSPASRRSLSASVTYLKFRSR